MGNTLFAEVGMRRVLVIGVAMVLGICARAARGQEAPRVVWELAKAHREATILRERVSLNGVWRWQPASAASGVGEVPDDRWGHFKVPGSWPGITDYMQKDCQTVYAHPAWKDVRMGGVTAAWYERELEVPAEWKGRSVVVTAEYLNSHAIVFVDGKKAGEMVFPAGEVDVTALCRPGEKHRLSMLVTAMPLKGVMLSYTDSASAREVKGSVARRGLCGDVWLVGRPNAERITDVRVETSVRKGEMSVDVAVEGLEEGKKYALVVRVWDAERQQYCTRGNPFTVAELKGGRTHLVLDWKAEQLWDLHAPKTYAVRVTLVNERGRGTDTYWPVRFGFREFWIDGRDFYLNGSRIYLSSVPLDNAQVGAAWASYEGAKESLKRLKSFGINFVYTHNYDCLPGSHLSFEEILRAADDVGMLVGLTQPHFSHYEWKTADADETNGYAKHAAFYVRAGQNHPSVIAYPMSHNATGYSEDMNPFMIDGVQGPRDSWASNNAKLAMRAEAIVKKLDPSRIVYHHAGGNLGAIYTSNFYANFAPVQEMSDWFGHWATHGVKPLFTCEFAVPFTWDWTMYRGWYKGQREFGSAKVPWEFCVAEWNAQFVGDKAYAISEAEKVNLRWEAKQFKAGSTWHRWDYPHQVGSTVFTERYPIIAEYLTDNWRAFRTWGVSAASPWESGHYWRLKPGVKRGRQELAVDWETLQRPGFSADYLDQRYERMDLAYEGSDWEETEAAKALIRNNRELLAYVAGKGEAFTSKDRNFVAGETVEKQIVVINNSRRSVKAECSWTLALPAAVEGKQSVTVETGQQQRIVLRIELPKGLAPGRYELGARVAFDGGEVQTDALGIHVVPRAEPVKPAARVAAFDPKGESVELLKRMGVDAQSVDAKADLSWFDVLVIGKNAMTVSGDAPDLSRVRAGLKVIVFEQTGEVLERRLGFRVAEYGLRRVFPRVDHPALAGLAGQNLQDWRGEATAVPGKLSYEMRPRYGPTVQWAGIPVTRLWRCGSRGNVASVLIEKPARGDFLPIVDGGYAMQYSPLMEYREGKGLVVFCQLDVTGRTEHDPAAEMLARNLVEYVMKWEPTTERSVVYAGDEKGREYLRKAGVKAEAYQGGAIEKARLVVVGPGGMNESLGRWAGEGGRVLAIGMEQGELNGLKLETKQAEHIAAYFEAMPTGSAFAGVGPADVHNRDPRVMPLVIGGATVVGDGILASRGNLVFSQLAPWAFDPKTTMNVKRTFRRVAVLNNRILANLGVRGATPVLERFAKPVDAGKPERRWEEGLYLDLPEEWDDPYRFFRW